MSPGKTYDYIFLDLDGPVLDGKYKHYICYRDITEGLGGKPMDIELYWTLKRQRTSIKVFMELSLLEGREKEFSALWKENIETAKYLRLDQLKPRIPESLCALQRNTLHLWLVTNRRNGDALNEQLKELGIGTYFEKIICADSNMWNSKYQMLTKIQCINAVIIGDTEADREVALRLNIGFIAVYNGLRTKELFVGNTGVEELYQIIGGTDEKADC